MTGSLTPTIARKSPPIKGVASNWQPVQSFLAVHQMQLPVRRLLVQSHDKSIKGPRISPIQPPEWYRRQGARMDNMLQFLLYAKVAASTYMRIARQGDFVWGQKQLRLSGSCCPSPTPLRVRRRLPARADGRLTVNLVYPFCTGRPWRPYCIGPASEPPYPPIPRAQVGEGSCCVEGLLYTA